MSKKVYVGMSGGVDSSLTAALLVEQGYNVTGVYMKNWTQDLPGMICPWADDLADAKRVAVQLGIPFKVFDFQKEYKQKVVDYMIAEYQAGRTPNPDIMCNQEVKFKVFLQAALEDGADMIATGHYARVAHVGQVVDGQAAGLASVSRKPAELSTEGLPQTDSVYMSSLWDTGDRSAAISKGDGVTDSPTVSQQPLMYTEQVLGSPSVGESANTTMAQLKTAVDTAKDQTYFLYRVTEDALSKTLFPLGEFTKPKVRQMAEERGLVTATKKDSQGICFVGKVGIKDFLQQYVTTESGDIIDKQTGKLVGRHDGAIFYTFGQRHGLGVGGGLPYYVVGKDMQKNIVYVTTNLNDESLWRDTLTLAQLHWINGALEQGKTYKVRTRYRAPLVDATVESLNDDQLVLRLADPERAITPGQSTVMYDGDRVVGGGIIAQ